MDISKKRSLAQLALRVGLDLQKNQCLLITVSTANYDYARVIAQEAYRLGARYVRILILDNELIKARAEHSSRENLSYVPPDSIERGQMEIDEDWARIRIDNTEESGLLKEVDPDCLSEILGSYRRAFHFVQNRLMRHQHSWLVLAVPGPNWARTVYGLADNASEKEVQVALEKFEALFISILRLDREDPVAVWRELGRVLAERSNKLSELKLDRLRFLSGKTDLSVGLASTHRWQGGPSQLPDGRWHEANLPSEEVFTTPDYRRTEGFVQVVRPVTVMETTVEKAWFRFEEGRVVDFGAEVGVGVLEKFLSIDDGARFLGEVALVDVDSPINRSGLVFGSILFDENASCHIALGAGYPSCLTNADELQQAEDLKAAGCNLSLIHNDFMIGTDETAVIGYRADGQAIQLMKEGKFVI